MSLLYGRYAVAATWYEFLLHGSILNNTFVPIETGKIQADPDILQLIKGTVHRIVLKA
jgi:hypothetical protein